MKYDISQMMAICLICTIILEESLAFILRVRNKKDFLNILLVNILTNPFVATFPFYINLKYGIYERYIALYILEIFAVIVEGILYKKYLKYKKINPFLLSLILNTFSYLAGIGINYLLYK